jgi:hypothetical protein
LSVLDGSASPERRMINCILTIDYEIYGNGTGSLKALIVDPMRKLQSICRRWGAHLVVFVEVAELQKIEASRSDPEIETVKQQIRELYREGHEIGLHLHPQWCNAKYQQGRWLLDDSEYNLCTLRVERISQIIDESLRYLRRVLNQPRFTPLSFRAGNWLFQPSEHLAAVLAERGIKIDSSVFKGGVQHHHGLDYRGAQGNAYFWQFRVDVIRPDSTGTLLEVPVYTEMVPFWKMVTSKRIAFTNGAGASGKSISRKLNRARDFLRFRYPLKLDFCRMTREEMTTMVGQVLKEDQENPSVCRPLVAIGHTKDFTDPKALDEFFSFLSQRKVPISTFEAVYSEHLHGKPSVAMASLSS